MRKPFKLRPNFIDFTRGVMDRVRDLAGVQAAPSQFQKTAEGWEWHSPSGIVHEFKFLLCHHLKGVRRLGYRERRPKAVFVEIAQVRNEDEAERVILLFLRGVKDNV